MCIDNLQPIDKINRQKILIHSLPSLKLQSKESINLKEGKSGGN